MLKWKKKLWWIEKGIVYIHPIPAFAMILLMAWAALKILLTVAYS
jgi:hypothetical protein